MTCSELGGIYHIPNQLYSSVQMIWDAASSSAVGWAQSDDSTFGQSLWLVEPVANQTTYTIRNLCSGMYLSLADNTDGTDVVGVSDASSDNQRWNMWQDADFTYYEIQNQETSTCMDLYNGGTNNGQPVVGWDCATDRTDPAGSVHRRWQFELVGQTLEEIPEIAKGNITIDPQVKQDLQDGKSL